MNWDCIEKANFAETITLTQLFKIEANKVLDGSFS